MRNLRNIAHCILAHGTYAYGILDSTYETLHMVYLHVVYFHTTLRLQIFKWTNKIFVAISIFNWAFFGNLTVYYSYFMTQIAEYLICIFPSSGKNCKKNNTANNCSLRYIDSTAIDSTIYMYAQ